MQILGPAKDFPVLHDAIAKVPLKDIEFLIKKIRVDLALRDENGNNAVRILFLNFIWWHVGWSFLLCQLEILLSGIFNLSKN